MIGSLPIIGILGSSHIFFAGLFFESECRTTGNTNQKNLKYIRPTIPDRMIDKAALSNHINNNCQGFSFIDVA